MEVLETGDKALSSHKRRTMVKHWQFCAVRSFARDANCIQAHNQLIPRSPHSIVPHLAMGLYNISLVPVGPSGSRVPPALVRRVGSILVNVMRHDILHNSVY